MTKLSATTRSEIERIHQRYLVEVVEGMGLCPFARKSRELGRVHRPIIFVDQGEPDPGAVASQLQTLLAEHSDAEIVLLTFVTRDGHAWAECPAFDAWVPQLREAWKVLDVPRFYMVGFHPRYKVTETLTPDTLVQLIRRSPDPVVQCVNALVLDTVKAQSRQQARQRFLHSLETDFPNLDSATKKVLARSVQTESELSRDIAARNFATVGEETGRQNFEAVIADILNERAAVEIRTE